MEKFLRKDAELMALFKSGNADLVISPNNKPANGIDAVDVTQHHGDFDDDGATVKCNFAAHSRRRRVQERSDQLPALGLIAAREPSPRRQGSGILTPLSPALHLAPHEPVQRRSMGNRSEN